MTLKRLLKIIKKEYGKKVIKEYAVKIMGTFNNEDLGSCGVSMNHIKKEITIRI